MGTWQETRTCLQPGGRASPRHHDPRGPHRSCPVPRSARSLRPCPPRGRPRPAGAKATVPRGRSPALRPRTRRGGRGGPPARPRSSKTPREGRGPHEEKNRTPRSNRTAHALTRLVCTREATEARACDGENGTSVRNGTRPHGPPPRDSPRSVLGPARSCLNLSSREASLSLKAELPRVPGWDVPPSAPVAEGGRDWDRGRGAVSLALSAEEERAEGERGLPGLPPLPPRPRTCCATFRVNAARHTPRPASAEQRGPWFLRQENETSQCLRRSPASRACEADAAHPEAGR